MPATDVIVVGGGVVGCAAAYFLAREGLRVELLERDDIAAHASGAAAGMLAPISEVPTSGPLLSLCLKSLGMFPGLVGELRERSGVDAEYEQSGLLRIAGSEAEARRLRERLQRLPGHGLQWVGPEDLTEWQPGLADPVHGALFSSREGHVRSPLLTRAFAAAAEASGARVETGLPVLGLLAEAGRVVGVETARGTRRAGWVVLCTGIGTGSCLASVGAERFGPVEPVRGQVVILESSRPGPRSILWRDSLYLVPKRDGSLVVGATEERVGFDCRVTAAGLRRLLADALALLPELEDWSFRAPFAGLRPATPDGLPLVGPVPGLEGLVVAAGHFRNGVLLAPVTASLVSDRVLGKDADPEARAFLPGRLTV
jgi:glycine oxidase